MKPDLLDAASSIILQYTERQREALECIVGRPDIRQVGIGGARGGGKTRVVCKGVGLRASLAEGVRHLCVRRVQSSADLNIGNEFRKVFKELRWPLGSRRKGEIQWYTKDKIFEFPNESTIKLGFCLKENDWEMHQGIEWATVHLGEATQFPELVYRRLGGSNRSDNPFVPGKKIVDFNPGGIGHEWCEKIFYNPKTRERRTAWIPMGIRDSQAVLENDPGYVLRTLRGIPDWLRRQWEEGDMNAVAGQYWQIPPDQITDDVQVPRSADWYAGVDYGRAKPFAVIYIARWVDYHPSMVGGVLRFKPFDRVHVFAEIYEAGLDLDQQANLVRIKEQSLPLNGRQVLYYADPATGKEIEGVSTETSRTICSTWNDYGFFTVPASSNARVPGWNRIKMLLRRGNLTISPKCLALLGEMRAAVAEGAPGPPTSEDLKQGPTVMDHAEDALRYVIVSTFGFGYSEEERDPYEEYE